MNKKQRVMDGNQACAYISYAFTEVAGIYPITPSSPMAEHVDEWAAQGRKNLFGQTVEVVEMQSEGGAAGAVHGALQAGALTTTYTASQGLLLMIPNMYKIAGELLPGVFHVSARTLSTHALSIFGDHSDVMACRQTGFAMLVSSNPQEVMDLGAVAHLSAIRGRVPFLHFFDGFRTSHELQKIDCLNYDSLVPLLDREALARFRTNALNPGHPCTRGTTQSGDIFFQLREAANGYYTALPAIVESYMEEINRLTGQDYHLFNYYGAPDAQRIVVVMGSAADTVRETVEALIQRGERVGMLAVHLYRPFSAKHFLDAVPTTVKSIAVLDRTKEPGSLGEPLYQDVCSVFHEAGRKITVVGGRYGLSSKDTTPGLLLAVFEHLKAERPESGFTLGITDDVTGLSLDVGEEPDLSPEGQVSCQLWGLGSDGTVGANKNAVKIIGEHTPLFTQAYFVYDSKKSGGLTQSHLRFGPREIRAPYLVRRADLIACHAPSYLERYHVTRDLKEGGVFLLNCQWSPEELEEKLPGRVKRDLCAKGAKLYLINAIDLARELGLGGHFNLILQTAFFRLVGVLPMEKAVAYLKKANADTYRKKGVEVVERNASAIDRALAELKEVPVPPAWGAAADQAEAPDGAPDFVRTVVRPMGRQEGDAIPVSALVPYADGTWPAGTAAYEKRGAAVEVPVWNADKCIQCNQCALFCPHAAIRPVLLDGAEAAAKPAGFETRPARGRGLSAYQYRIQVSPLDCTGCGNCAAVCDGMGKALTLRPLDTQRGEAAHWTYAAEEVAEKPDAVDRTSLKGSQFATPLFEFSGACAGCGETPYLKLLTQLFGERMYCSNASGCSTAFSGSTPASAYTKTRAGRGPAWAMSLFEDSAEYIYGMYLGAEKVRARLAGAVCSLLADGVCPGECAAWLERREEPEETVRVSEALAVALGDAARTDLRAALVVENKDFLPKKSYWGLGGDGWGYDIGYGGLDHVLASGKNINLLVMDTEVYSNTGGQSSKATVTGAIAKFAADGKRTKKKDLGLMVMSYGYVYVAQVALGYDPAQTLRAIREAEAYDGPSLIIAYCPCMEHGLKAGLAQSQLEAKRAVEAGYFHTYRYDPDRRRVGKNPFQLDSKEPTADFVAFLRGETRFAALEIANPAEAAELYEKARQEAAQRLAVYRQLAGS